MAKPRPLSQLSEFGASVQRKFLRAGDPDVRLLRKLHGTLSLTPIPSTKFHHIWIGEKRRIVDALAASDASSSDLTYLTGRVCEILEEPVFIILRETGIAAFVPGRLPRRLNAGSTSLYWRGEVRTMAVLSALSVDLSMCDDLSIHAKAKCPLLGI